MEDKDIEVLGNTEQFNFVDSSTNSFSDTNIEEVSEEAPVPNDSNIVMDTIEDNSIDTLEESTVTNDVTIDTNDVISENVTPIPETFPNNSSEVNTVVNDKPLQNKHNSYFNRITKYSICCIISVLAFICFLTFYSLISKKVITYSENSNLDYQVCLKENNYYQEKCLGSGIEYVSSITDFIRADFNYSAVYQTKMQKKFKYYIQSKLVINTDDESEKELLKKEKKLTEIKPVDLNGNVLSIAESVDISFAEFNNYAQSYKNDYSLLSNCNLIVSLILQDGKDEKEVSSLSVPLTKLTYNITKKDLKNEVNVYKADSNSILKYILLLATFASLALVVFSGYKLLGFLWKTKGKTPVYQKKLNHILNTYDRVIVTLNDKSTIVNDQEIYKVQTFLELLDVRDTIDKPILYYKVNNIKSEFYVQDINKTYKFTLKESDFDSK